MSTGREWPAAAVGPLNIEIHGAGTVTAAMQAAPAAMRRELRVSNRQTGRQAQRWVRGAAGSGTPAQRHMAVALKGVGTSTYAALRVSPTATTAGANAVFFGMKGRSGWNLGWRDGVLYPRAIGTGNPQHPPWVGASWQPFTAGEGPYVINTTLALHQGEIELIYLDGQVQAVTRAIHRSL